MAEQEWLAERFEFHRTHLLAVAYRLLGSLNEAEDAVQEAWLRLSRTDTSAVENLGGWLTTVAGRLCLDKLRTRKARREELLDEMEANVVTRPEAGTDPESEVLLADSVGLALLVVLNTLNPAERIAFVLHDIFGVPLSEIARVIERSPVAVRQLASRARRRVRGVATADAIDLAQQRQVVDAFLAAARAGDFDRLLTLLDPNVVLQADPVAASMRPSEEVHGASAVARHFLGRASAARAALIDGRVGIVVAPRGRLRLVLYLTVTAGRITELTAVAEPARLQTLKLAVF